MTTLPPNEKTWSQAKREKIQKRLPGHMVLDDTYDIRVGQWFQIKCGGSIRIENIEAERKELIELFDSLGIEVRIPLVGMVRGPNSDGRTPSIGYIVEIQNWVAEGNLDEQKS